MGVTRRAPKSKKGKVKYQATVFFEGKAAKCKSFDTKSAAWAWHEKTLSELQTPRPSVQISEKMTLSEVYPKFCEVYVPTLRESTQQTQRNRHRYVVESPLFEMTMSDINAKAIDRWFEWIKKQPTAKSKHRKSFRHEFNFLRTILYWYREYYDEKYVVPILRRHCKAIFYKPIPPRRQDYFMRADQVEDWIKWLKSEKANPVYHQLAAFMVLTGCRLGEACGVHWEHVDMRNGIVSIVQTVWWDHYSKEPRLQDATKTDGSVRIVKLCDPLLEMLKRLKMQHGGSGPLFRREEGKLLLNTTVRGAFDQGFKALGLPWRATHICRHSFATLALREGGNLSAIQAALGHTDIRQTQRYAKVVSLLDGKVNDHVAKVVNLEL